MKKYRGFLLPAICKVLAVASILVLFIVLLLGTAPPARAHNGVDHGTDEPVDGEHEEEEETPADDDGGEKADKGGKKRRSKIRIAAVEALGDWDARFTLSAQNLSGGKFGYRIRNGEIIPWSISKIRLRIASNVTLKKRDIRIVAQDLDGAADNNPAFDVTLSKNKKQALISFTRIFDTTNFALTLGTTRLRRDTSPQALFSFTVNFGDVNGDGSVDSSDLALLEAGDLSGTVEPSDPNFQIRCDIDSDGSVSGRDLQLLQALVPEITPTPDPVNTPDPENTPDPQETPIVPDTTPPVISTLNASGSAAALVLNWMTDEPADSFVRCTSGETVFELDGNSGLTTTHSLVLNNLVEGQEYQCEARSADEAGNSASADVIFTTSVSMDTAGPVMSDLRLIGATRTTVTIAWTTDEPATTQMNPGESYTFDGDEGLVLEHTLTLTNLAPASAYHGHPTSIDAAGNLSYGHWYFYTAE